MNELANPLELRGFEFIEFVSQDGELDDIFSTIGFTKVAKHKSKNVYLWRQGQINIILNYQPESSAAFFYKEHGPSACAMGFRTKDAAKAFHKAVELGALSVDHLEELNGRSTSQTVVRLVNETG